MEHRHVCIAAGDFCLIWSSHTAMQCYCVIVMYRNMDFDKLQKTEPETEAPVVQVRHAKFLVK